MRIKLSQLKTSGFPDIAAYEQAVKDHIAALNAHRFTEGEAAPAPTSSIVEMAVKRVQYPIDMRKPDDFVLNFEIEDDTPPPPSLDERKMMLATGVNGSAMLALGAITPPLKARMLSLQVTEASGVDEKKRTPAQRALLADAENRRAREQAVHVHWATLESQIHDLTDATIDTWKAAPFPK